MRAEGPLERLVDGMVEHAGRQSDPARDRLLRLIEKRHRDGISAVLVYGSYLRGKRDTLLDFYVLLDGYRALRPHWHAALAWLLSPNVYQVCAGSGVGEVRAKYALLTLGRFERAMRRDPHPYFWARFAQPAGLLYCRDAASRARVIATLAQASRRFVTTVVPRMPEEFTARELIDEGLRLTYACELRSEPPGHAAALFRHNAAWFESMLRLLAAEHLGFERAACEGYYRRTTGPWRRRSSSLAWALRRFYGKIKSVLRLFKAALTFDGGLDYLLWKIARHSGHYIEPTARQRRQTKATHMGKHIQHPPATRQPRGKGVVVALIQEQAGFLATQQIG
ncbi:MAG: hypothetical protein RQ826_16735, partial [Xanthomonadales bacterium]|nr:hypothetical protein [Xanthomonadales bacterium]